jgi:hypothetical protein
MMSTRSLSWVSPALAVFWVISGCGGLTPIEDDGGEGGAVPPAVRAAFAGSCATPGCHDSGSRAGGLSLADADLGGLVGAPSAGSSLPLVEIGDVLGSYLAVKMLPDDVLAAQGVMRAGNRMPIGGEATNPNNATILAWIAGAEFPGGDSTTTTGDTTTDATTDATTDGGSGFDAEVWPILSMKCSCHLADPNDGLNGELSFPMATAYADLVGAPSIDVPAMNLVEPGDPSQSYLFLKLEDTHLAAGGSGVKMPIGAPLSDGEIATIEAWIVAGAPE